jgi:hypothetical protein
VDAVNGPSGAVVVAFPYEEAVVLADLLWRWERDELPATSFEDQAEKRVLWDLAASRVVASSRDKVRDSEE